MPYLLELRRDADTYHMVWADDAEPKGVGEQYNFDGDRAFAVAVDTDMAAMGEDDRLKELFKRARQHVADLKQQEDSVGQNPPPGAPAGRGADQKPRAPGAGASDG